MRATERGLPEDFVGGLIVTLSLSPTIDVFSWCIDKGVLVTYLAYHPTIL